MGPKLSKLSSPQAVALLRSLVMYLQYLSLSLDVRLRWPPALLSFFSWLKACACLLTAMRPRTRLQPLTQSCYALLPRLPPTLCRRSPTASTWRRPSVLRTIGLVRLVLPPLCASLSGIVCVRLQPD